MTQAQASATNAAASLERLTTLLEKKVTTRAKVDDAQAQATASAAALAQAVKQLENAKENLTENQSDIADRRHRQFRHCGTLFQCQPRCSGCNALPHRWLRDLVFRQL